MVEPSSRLGRLFTYSKDTAFEAQENFTTEALAIAVADDPRPMLDALRQLDPARADKVGLHPGVRIRPSTQVALLGGGWLDLVLEVLDERGRTTGEVWIEVKIGAPESGLQLDWYERGAADVHHPVWLLTLAREPIRQTVPNLTWNELYRAIKHLGSEHRSWKDVRAFLKEQNVASDALGPISDREAASAEPAFELLQKVSELVIAVHRNLPEWLPGPVAAGRWTAEGALLNYVGQTFRATGELVGAVGPITWGLVSDHGTAYWMVAVRAGRAGRTKVEEARRMADQAGPGPQWDRPASGPTILAARARATAVETHDAALDWFEARLREVATWGVVETLMRSTAAGPPDVELVGADLP